MMSNFFFFSQCFLTFLENFQPFSLNLTLSSADYVTLEESNTCRLGNGCLI